MKRTVALFVEDDSDYPKQKYADIFRFLQRQDNHLRVIEIGNNEVRSAFLARNKIYCDVALIHLGYSLHGENGDYQLFAGDIAEILVPETARRIVFSVERPGSVANNVIEII
jgi:hypothetical protein